MTVRVALHTSGAGVADQHEPREASPPFLRFQRNQNSIHNLVFSFMITDSGTRKHVPLHSSSQCRGTEFSGNVAAAAICKEPESAEPLMLECRLPEWPQQCICNAVNHTSQLLCPEAP